MCVLNSTFHVVFVGQQRGPALELQESARGDYYTLTKSELPPQGLLWEITLCVPLNLLFC